MSRHSPRLFARLRRHRGVWVLALAVLLFKVAMSTFCVLDGPRVAFGGDTASAVAVATGNGDDCVLGEGGGCHCTCAHAVALPAVDAGVTVDVILLHPDTALSEPLSPAFFRSPLRPPIA